MKPTYPHLLSLIRVGNLTLKNRMISANALPHFCRVRSRFLRSPALTMWSTWPKTAQRW